MEAHELTLLHSLSDNIGLLLLCEAAVRPFLELKGADYNADQGCKTAKALSVHFTGPPIAVFDQALGPRKALE